jgi:hypothetical protein
MIRGHRQRARFHFGGVRPPFLFGQVARHDSPAFPPGAPLTQKNIHLSGNHLIKLLSPIIESEQSHSLRRQ